MPFNVGDSVRVVDNMAVREFIEVGNEYLVRDVRNKNWGQQVDIGLLFRGQPKWFNAARFAPVENVQAVRLLVLKGIENGPQTGDIVTVKKEGVNTYVIEGFPGKQYSKRRFGPAPEKKAPRMVDRKLVRGEAVMVVVKDEKWGAGNWKAQRTPDDILGKRLVVKTVFDTHVNGVYCEFDNPFAIRQEQPRILYFPATSLAFWEEGVDIAIKPAEKAVEPPKKPALPPISDFIKKAGTDSLCAFAWQIKGEDEYSKYFSAPCFAHFGYFDGPIVQLAVSMKNAHDGGWALADADKERFLLWSDYIYNKSPWSAMFINKRPVKEMYTTYYEVDTSKTPSMVFGACTAMREGYESASGRLKVFTHFIDEGYCEHTAYLMAYAVRFSKGKWELGTFEVGHTNMDGNMDAESLFKFFREGYHEEVAVNQKGMNEKIAKYHGSRGIAHHSRDSFNQFIQTNLVLIKKGQGWNATTEVQQDSVKTLADAIEAKVKA